MKNLIVIQGKCGFGKTTLAVCIASILRLHSNYREVWTNKIPFFHMKDSIVVFDDTLELDEKQLFEICMSNSVILTTQTNLSDEIMSRVTLYYEAVGDGAFKCKHLHAT